MCDFIVNNLLNNTYGLHAAKQLSLSVKEILLQVCGLVIREKDVRVPRCIDSEWISWKIHQGFGQLESQCWDFER